MHVRKFFGFIFIFFLILALPLLVFITQFVTHTKQHASSPCGSIYSVSCEIEEAADADGRRELFYVSNGGSLYHLYQEPSNATVWSVPVSLGNPSGVALDRFSVVLNINGQLEVYAIGNNKQMYRLIQTNQNGSWGTWGSMGAPNGVGLTRVHANFNLVWQNNAAVLFNVDVFALGTDGSVYHIWELPKSTTLSAWSSLGKPGNNVTLQTLTETDNGYSMLTAPWGREEVFSLGSDGNLYHIYQGTSNTKTWSVWSSLGKPVNAAKLTKVYAAHNCCTTINNNITHDINIFVLDANGQQFNISQTQPNGGWGTWTEIANPQGVQFVELTGAMNSPQNKPPYFFSIFGLGSNGNVYEMSQQTSGLNPILWTKWQNLNSPSSVALLHITTNMYPSIVSNNVKIQGNIELFAIGSNSNLYHIWQVSPLNTSWSPWSVLWAFTTTSPSPSPSNSPSPSLSPSPSPSPSPSLSPSPTPEVGNVSIKNTGFKPININVSVNTKVIWTNNDTVNHTVTADAGNWDSGTLTPGSSFSHIFTAVGIHKYHDKLTSAFIGSVTVTATSPTPSTTESPSPSPSPDLSPSPINSPSPSLSASPNPSLSPNPSGNQVVLSLVVGLHDIGKGGDNVNPNSVGTLQPEHPVRNVTVNIYDLKDSLVTTGTGQIQIDTASDANQGLFTGSVAVQNITHGQYQIFIKSDGYLQKRIPQVITLTNGIVTTIPSVYLTTGDINNDNILDALDYQALIRCFGTPQTNPNYDCAYPITQQSTGADIDDDGVVDGIDYNMFVRELSSQSGQ